jgi:uncharacterized phage protein (TIGR02218 family)
MRSLTSGLITALASEATDFARAVVVTRTDGTIKRWADLQDDATISSNTYTALAGLEIASMPFVMNGGATRVDVQMAANVAGTPVDRADVRDGLYDKAEIVISLIDHQQLVRGLGILFAGTIGEVKLSTFGKVVFECVGILGKAKTLATEHRTPSCRNWFGDSRCGVNKAALGVSTTVSTVSTYTLTLASVGGQPDEHFKNGTAEYSSGQAKGRVDEIRSQVGTTVMRFSDEAPVAPGDAVTIFPGCDYTNGLLGCQRYSNCINQQADPFVPGQDARNINYESG